MSTRSGIGVLVLAALITTLSALPAVAATRVRAYTGETSQGKRIEFRIEKTDRGRFLRSFELNHTLTCEDGTSQEWGSGWGWGGRGPTLADAVRLDLDDNYDFAAVHVHGRIGQFRGAGTFEYTVAMLTDSEEAQACTTGELTWTVEFHRRIKGARLASRLGPSVDGLTRAHMTRSGDPVFEVTRY